MTWCQNRIYGAEFSKEDIRKAVEKSGLLSMEIEFNSDCNFNCVYCYSPNISRKSDELTPDEFCCTIRQGKELGVKKIIVLGGEPMLYPTIMEMTRFIRAEGLALELFTNGANITRQAAREFVGLGVTVVLKMNSREEKIQDMLTGKKGSYRQIQAALENLKEAGFPEKHHMGISTIICRQNADEIAPMWKWLREEGIDPYFEMTSPHGNAKVNNFLHVEPEKIKEIFDRVASIDRETYCIDWSPRPPLVGGSCLRHQYSCFITCHGDVQPCVGITIPVGNVKKEKLATIIKDSEVIGELRNYRERIKGPCAECEMRVDCYGCRGTAYQTTGDYLASDPSCWKNSDRQEDIARMPVDAAPLVPHDKPMLLIETLLSLGEKTSVSRMVIREDNIFLGNDGILAGSAYVELIAQAMAAQHGFETLGRPVRVKGGFLVGVKNLEVKGFAVKGDVLDVHIEKTGKYGNVGILIGEVFKGSELIASGELKIWQEEQAQ